MDTNFKQMTENVNMKISILVFLGAISLGGILGWGISKMQPSSSNTNSTTNSQDNSQTSKTVGVANKKNFKDTVEGTLKEGGIDGEGNFYIERPGGPSQNAYLTSTTIDLSEFVGKKVKCWGETYKGEKVGWLMDVGLVEVLQ